MHPRVREPGGRGNGSRAYNAPMMRALAGSLGSLLLLACSSAHPASDGGTPGTDAGVAEFAGAYIGRDCAPDDGLAYRLVLFQAAVPECSADPSRASLSFWFFEGTDAIFPLMDGSVVTSSAAGGGFGNGTATYCPGGTPPCETSPEFTLRFERFEDLGRAAGTYTVELPTGTRSGVFDASFCEGFGPPMCG